VTLTWTPNGNGIGIVLDDIDLAEPLYDKARTLGQQNNDPNAATFKANYERAHGKLKETTKKQ